MALDPRCVAVQRNAGVELATASMVSGRFGVLHQLALLGATVSCSGPLLNKERMSERMTDMDTKPISLPENADEDERRGKRGGETRARRGQRRAHPFPRRHSRSDAANRHGELLVVHCCRKGCRTRAVRLQKCRVSEPRMNERRLLFPREF